MKIFIGDIRPYLISNRLYQVSVWLTINPISQSSLAIVQWFTFKQEETIVIILEFSKRKDSPLATKNFQLPRKCTFPTKFALNNNFNNIYLHDHFEASHIKIKQIHSWKQEKATSTVLYELQSFSKRFLQITCYKISFLRKNS